MGLIVAIDDEDEALAAVARLKARGILVNAVAFIAFLKEFSISSSINGKSNGQANTPSNTQNRQ